MESTDGGLNVILEYVRLPARVAPNEQVELVTKIEMKYLSKVLSSF